MADGAGSTSTALLPAVDQTIDWVRLPQRFPVRMQVAGPTPMPLRIGQTVSVAIIPSLNLSMRPRGRLLLDRDERGCYARCFVHMEVALGRPASLVTYGYATGSRWAWRACWLCSARSCCAYRTTRILTVLVLMSAQFVGAVAFKALMRVTGTIAGALVGVWLVSDYTSTPLIFLPVLFLVMAFASYKFTSRGSRQGPTLTFCSASHLVVATDGIAAPDQAWQIGLDRAEEIVVGILSSLLVTTLVWPRYAREEFLNAGRVALKTVSRLVAAQSKAYLDPAAVAPEVDTLQQAFDQQLVALRNLRQAGARESTAFAASPSHYDAFLGP